MKTFYYPRTTYNISVAFSDLFNDIVIRKYNKARTVVENVKVPLAFGNRDKFWDIRKEQEEKIKYNLQLPRMSFSLVSLSYDSERALSPTTQRKFWDENVSLSDLSNFFTDIIPSPYNFEYNLEIRAEKMEDYTQIIEQILPYFNPSQFLRVKEFSFLNLERDLKVIMNPSINLDLLNEQDEQSRREIKSVLSFTVYGYLYKPYESTNIPIKIIQSRYWVDEISATNITSASAYEVNQFRTSGFFVNSAGDLSGVPGEGQYDFSAFSDDNDMYYFTSADGML